VHGDALFFYCFSALLPGVKGDFPAQGIKEATLMGRQAILIRKGRETERKDGGRDRKASS